MKKYYIYILTAVLPILWGACNNGDDIDTKHSIFSTEPMEHNGFDEWLLANYTYPYNVDFKYRMQDIESDHKYNLVPADYDKSVALAKIIKHVWMEAYTELAGPAFLRSYVPKTFHLIGSPAYDSSGTKVLGTAEGGKKITLYEVNSLDFENVDIEVLNEYYFKTMHHELHISCIRSVIMTHRLIALPKENMLVPTGISMLLKMEIHICERMRMHGRKDL